MLVNYRKIMVTLDGSPVAAEAVPHAVTAAKAFGADLVLFRVVRDASKPMSAEDGVVLEDLDPGGVDQRQQGWIDDAKAYLDQKQAELAEWGIAMEKVVEVGVPTKKIVEYAYKQDVDLIVMTTHGRTGVSRMIYGSVAEDVLRMAPCPTLLIRSA